MRKNIFYFDSSDANRLIDFLLYKFNKKFPELEIENFRYKLHHELMEYVHAESRKIPEELLERFPHEWRRELDFMLDQMKTIQAKLIGSISSNVDSKLESHQKKMLEIVESNSGVCQYERNNSKDEYSRYFSAKSELGKDSAPNPEGFIKRIRNHCQLGETLVLVDPYALSEKNDKGEIQQPAKDLIEIIKDLPFKKLFLYCRQDAVHQPAFNALMAARGNKEIALLYGDFHDRYLIVGRNQTTASFNFISSSSYKTDYWKAYVFGASLNGVSKRPTYIVGLEKEDTAAVMKYINEVSPIQ